MRNTYKYIITIAASLLVGVTAFAQTQKTAAEAIKVDKKSEPNRDGTYTLSMEAFLTGYASDILEHVTKAQPLDVALVLDFSLSMGNELGYDKLNSASYSYNNYGTSQYYYLDGNEFYRVYRGYNGSGTSRRYHLYYTKNNTNYYLTGTTTTTTRPTNVSSNTGTIWTGSLYQKNTSDRLTPLISACTAFIDKIAEKAEEDNVEHRISVIRFASKDSFAKELIGLSSEYNNVKAVLPKKSDLASGTYPSKALPIALGEMNDVPTDRKSSKLVVMFTDGGPGMAPDFNTPFDEDYSGRGDNKYEQLSEADAAIAAAKDLKDAGVTVYTVGTFDDSVHENVTRYMNYLSSNYPHATDFQTYTGTPEDTKYTANATNTAALTNVFTTIADEETGNLGTGEDIVLETSEVSVNDVVTPQFTVPGGVNSITVKVVKSKGATIDKVDEEKGQVWYTDNYTWDDAHAVVNPEGITVNLEGNNGEEKTVKITGFDFSSNWVGLVEEYEDGELKSSVPHGAKLVISFVVAPDPYSEGGAASTNDKAKSGVFVGSSNPTVVNFPEQPTRFTPMNLTISAEGLTEGLGESVIFNITSTDGLNMFVAFTEGEASSQTIAQLPVVKADGTTKIEYTVTPVTSWGWTYTHPEAGSAKTLDEKHEYSFKVDPVTKTIKHAENAKNNVLNR